jgi:beta-galactosidase
MPLKSNYYMMKIINVFFTLILCFLTTNAQQEPYSFQESRRYTKIINTQWTFNYIPDRNNGSGFESKEFDDSKWLVVSVPHTWSTYETTGELHPYIRNASEKDDPYWWNGWGLYRKHFTISKEFSGRRVFAEFEGVQKYCKVWINGKYLGDHKGGYGSFDFDVTSYIFPGEDNLLAVAVSNKMADEFKIPPMAAGNFDVYGGIYRDVTIVLKDNLYIPMQGSASHEGGTFVTTPEVSEKRGVVRVQTWVKNDNNTSKKCTLKSFIVDASDMIISEMKTETEIKPGGLYRFDQVSKPIKNPHLWSNEDPYLYKVYSEVVDGKIITDVFQSPLGFRWFYWDYNENFLYVNGKKMIIHGGNRHQEYPWLGDAIPKWITELDYNDMAVNLNYNFMRTAHYPNDKLVYELADRYGIVIDEETPSIKNQVFSVEVQEQQMKEMIRRDRNHPSIMLWSMGNETNHAVDSKFAVVEDTTRILTARRVTEGSAGAFVKHTDENLSIENLLRCTIRGWYNKDVKDLEPSDSQQSGTEEHQQNMLIASGRFGKANLCTWLYEDHGADREYLNEPLLHVNPKGYVDSYRVPKYAYFFWQANYFNNPMIFILPHFWRSQYLNQKKDINIDSNCDTVELFVNGTSMGTRYPGENNFHNVTFKNILVQKGTLSATGRRNGQTVKTKVVMAGAPAKIILSSSHKNIKATMASVAIIKADITDASGNHINGATNTIKWRISGPATLVGPDIYESDIDKHHAMDGTMYTDMPVANIIRSDGNPGIIIITVSASGLASGTIEIIAEKLKTDDSVITEPEINNAGRLKVVRNKSGEKEVIPVPQELKPALDEFNLKPADKLEYATFIRNYMLDHNPNLDTSCVELKVLTDLFSNQLFINSGKIIADDYNFSVDHFNKCRLLSRYIDNTGLPEPFRKGLRKYYANQVIRQGMEKNASEELEWLKSIPVDGNVVFVQDSNSPVADKGGVLTTETDLQVIVAAINHGFNNLTEEMKSEVLASIVKVNPYISAIYKSGQSREGDKRKVTNVTYKIEKGEPIWIPALKSITPPNPLKGGYYQVL